MALDPLTVFEAGRDQYVPLVDSFQLILDRSAASAVLRLQYAPLNTLAYADCLTVSVAGVVAIPTTLDVNNLTVNGSAGTATYVLTSNGAGLPPSWQVSTGGGSTPHALLDGVVNNDTLAAGPTRGDLIVANATPKWAAFAVGASGTYLAGGTDPSWTTLASATVTSITGTASQVIASASVGAVTLSLPNPINVSTTGSAATLTTARTIAGVSFDGSANIAIASTGLSDTANLARLDAANVFSSATGQRATKLGIGVAPTRFLDVLGTTEQARFSYDASNYVSHTVGITGVYTVQSATGSIILKTATADTNISIQPAAGGQLGLNSLVTTGPGTSSAFAINATALTSGTALYAAASTITSGKLIDLQVSGTAALTNQTGLNILVAGANATGAQTTYGSQISNTHTGTSINVGASLSASGGSSNYGLLVPAGLVGIGMTPVRTLDVTGTFGVTGAATLGSSLSIAGQLSSTSTAGIGLSISNNSYATLDLTNASTGTTAGARLSLQNSVNAFNVTVRSTGYTPSGAGADVASGLDATWGGSGGIALGAVGAGGNLRFYTGGFNQRMEIASTGATRMHFYGAGAATFDASGNITSVSDARFKIVQGDFIAGLAEVLALRPVRFTYTVASGLDRTNVYAGLIAQAVLPYIPEAVGKDPQGLYTFNDRPIMLALVNAIQEQQREIDALKRALSLPVIPYTAVPLLNEDRVIKSSPAMPSRLEGAR